MPIIFVFLIFAVPLLLTVTLIQCFMIKINDFQIYYLSYFDLWAVDYPDGSPLYLCINLRLAFSSLLSYINYKIGFHYETNNIL